MIARGTWIVAWWLAGVAAAVAVVAQARYITDLSAFLPATPTPLQRLLVEQLRAGPASRLILAALEGGTAAQRARVSKAMTQRLRNDAAFSSVENGTPLAAERDREFLFQHRYVLSDAVDAAHFSAAGLRSAIEETIDGLASSAGLMLKPLVPRDPTGEMLHIIEGLAGAQGPRSEDGVWTSADATRTLLAVQTSAAGSDTDSQERDIEAVRAAFRATLAEAGTAASVRLRLSGPGIFAVDARAKIKRAAMRLSLISSLLIAGIMLAVYRSIPALALGLLPVATGALCGVAAVALGFGSVHATTLGFGVTLIGESVDYSIYFFIQSLRTVPGGSGTESWRRVLWPTVRLGMFTSVCGFASLLPSGFPGLSQLGLYSVSGLIAAALVTRFVLPEMLPREFKIRDLAPLGLRIGRLRRAVHGQGRAVILGSAAAIAVAALVVLVRHRDTLWNRELAALSPVPSADLRYDALLRADLGAADVLDIVIVPGGNMEDVLRGAELARAALQPLADARVIAAVDSPTVYLPSVATQLARRNALPDSVTLQANLKLAVADLNIKAEGLSPFVADAETARRAPPVTAQDLRGTSLAAGFDALILHDADRWSALLPLHSAAASAAPDLRRVAAALQAAGLPSAQVLDLKAQTDALYDGYLRQAIRWSGCGFGLVVLLLCLVLRSPLRVARVLAPLVLAVLSVAAGLAACGQQLNLLHLVGMLLIVAVGSNYALFFDADLSKGGGVAPLMLASVMVANASTVLAFALLSFSQVPVLEALGTTVAPGAFLALLFSAAMTTDA